MRKLLLMAALLAAPAVVWSDMYELDPAHSAVGFKIRHMMVSKVHGRFGTFTGTIDYDEKDPAKGAASATISAASIDTGNEKRDEHLRSADFFDTGKYPNIEFKSTGVEKAKDGSLKLKGDLTMHGVTKPVVLDLEFNGLNRDPQMGTRAGFAARGKLDRTDFGIKFNKVLDTGGLAVGNEVEIEIDAEGVLKAEPKGGK